MVPSPVRVAIVDTPFQMDHPDLVANTATGWDAVTGLSVTSSAGNVHSTLCAGLVAAGLNNGIGVAGVANCTVLPISIIGSIAEMCNAVYWAASNNVRVVNISWTGGESDALNEAGRYLRVNARGLLVMSGWDGSGQLDYPNQPDIWCISMTDAANNPRSRYGAAIDIAAPGWNIYSTTTGGGYGSGIGTSFSAPIFAGVCARLFSINPALGPEEVIDILKTTAIDFGEPGWDMWFGWGRIDFGAAAALAYARLPRLSILSRTDSQITLGTGLRPGLPCQLWRKEALGDGPWSRVNNAVLGTNADQLSLSDTSPGNSLRFYRISINQ